MTDLLLLVSNGKLYCETGSSCFGLSLAAVSTVAREADRQQLSTDPLFRFFILESSSSKPSWGYYPEMRTMMATDIDQQLL